MEKWGSAAGAALFIWTVARRSGQEGEGWQDLFILRTNKNSGQTR